MRNIVERLQEKRNIEVAKEILEGAGYRIVEANEDKKSESLKIRKMTKEDGMSFDGAWRLPSGPGLIAENDSFLVSLVGAPGDGYSDISLELSFDNPDPDEDYPYGYALQYKYKEEKEAIKKFKEIVSLLNKGEDPEKVAKKMGMSHL